MFMGAVVILIVGTLIVNYLRGTKGSIPQELLNNQNSVEASVKTHKVENGENLWVISEKYYNNGSKWVDIATENKLSDASKIEVGQELVIPEINETLTESSTEKTVEQLDANIDNPITSATYEVEKGDSLWKIAVRAYGDGYKWVDIAKENKLAFPNLIHTGNILVLPR